MKRRGSPARVHESTVMPITTPTDASTAFDGMRSARSSAAATSAKSGAELPMALDIVGPRRSVDAKLRSVTTAGKKSPTSAKTSAAATTKPLASKKNGVTRRRSSVAVGTLITAPARGSR